MTLQRQGFILVLLTVFLTTGCTWSWFGQSSAYDEQPMNIQTVSLFNQRSPSRLAKKNWKGDWIFRRDRLEMIDAQLHNTRPDLILLQEVMAKEGSPFESDRNILRAGVLADYDWRDVLVAEYEDTQEQQTQAIAIGSSLAFGQVTEEGERESWAMGDGGFLAATTVIFEDQALTVFNVEMPTQADGDYLWYSFIQQRVEERLSRLRLCNKRVIIAGHMPGDLGSRRFSDFMTALQLRDAATGFCQIASNCFTATPLNDIYMATIGDESPSRLDRVFVHQTAVVYSSGRNFEESDASNRYAKEFGLTKLWPTQRFGWNVSARFARCQDDELGLSLR